MIERKEKKTSDAFHTSRHPETQLVIMLVVSVEPSVLFDRLASGMA